MRRKIPSITAMLCFEAAAKVQSFVQAARVLNLSQSALGRQIQALEMQVGQPLFHRVRQRVHLTEAGQTLLADLSPQLATLEATFYRLRAHSAPGDALNIATYPTLGNRWLMPLLHDLNQVQPELTVNTLTFQENSQLDASELDLAIVQGDPHWPGFHADFLMTERLVAVASPRLLPAPLTDPNALLSLPALYHRTRPQTWQIWFDSLPSTLPASPAGPLFDQFEMLISAACQGHGVAILPQILVQAELRSGALHLAHNHVCTPSSAYYLLIPQAKTGTARIERARQWFLARTPALEADMQVV